MTQVRQSLRQALGQHIGQQLTPEVCARIETSALQGINCDSVPPWETYTKEGLLDLMAGNKDAAELVCMVANCSQVYDDLIDRDKPIKDDQIHAGMWAALFGISDNQFFKAHEHEFRGVMRTGLINWLAANQMEASGDLEQLRIAHVIRYTLGDVALLAMVLSGGHQHAMKNAARCRLMLQKDTWANYSKEHGHADSL